MTIVESSLHKTHNSSFMLDNVLQNILIKYWILAKLEVRFLDQVQIRRSKRHRDAYLYGFTYLINKVIYMVHCIFQNITRKAWKTLKTVSNKYSQQITDVPDSDKVIVEAQKTKRPLNNLTLWSQCLAWPQQQKKKLYALR